MGGCRGRISGIVWLAKFGTLKKELRRRSTHHSGRTSLRWFCLSPSLIPRVDLLLVIPVSDNEQRELSGHLIEAC